MKDDGLILAAWADAVEQNIPAVLATVVKVSGSAYRSPGARMLITEAGGRIGSISGGCLENDLLRKAWWLTEENAAAVRVYDNTSEDDAIWEFGLGCNGVVHVLLERWEAGSHPLTLDVLAASRKDRRGGVLATTISGAAIGQKLAVFPDGREKATPDWDGEIAGEARRTMETRQSALCAFGDTEVFIEYVAPPTPLVVFGAGHDALPVVRLAKELGWHCTVVDGRSNQARADRFPLADEVIVSDVADPLRNLNIDDRTVAVVMGHSYPQDAAFVNALMERPVRYLGVLGPRKRTERMLSENGHGSSSTLHSPIGLDIGADTPEEIGLAIMSEIQAVLAGRSAGMLRDRSGPIHSLSA